MHQLLEALEDQNTAKVVAKLLKMQKEKEELEKREKEEMQATGAFVELVQAKGLTPLFKSGNICFYAFSTVFCVRARFCLPAGLPVSLAAIVFFCQS